MANQSNNPVAALGEATRLTELRNRFLFLIGGLIVTETVFNIPGIARFLVEALRWRDYPIVQNLVMLIAVVTVVVNFLVDMIYVVLDPRIKYEG